MRQRGDALPHGGLSMELGLLLMAVSDQALPRRTVPLGGHLGCCHLSLVFHVAPSLALPFRSRYSHPRVKGLMQ